MDAVTLRRGQPGYEEARRATMWNARRTDRYPDVVVQARDVRDVVAAVQLAKAQGMRIGVRSGGHSWSRNHVRDGGMLLDVSRLDAVTIDPGALRATVGPGVRGDVLAEQLRARGLMFPAGHCRGVRVGGYLLQGGFGWHGRALGPACASVVAIDVVTADGEVVHCSETENADLLWAARGAGPGFFAVVTRFHLRVYPKPPVTGLAVQTFALDQLEDVLRWAHAVGPEVPRSVELQVVIERTARNVDGVGLTVVAPVFADGLLQAMRDVSFMGGNPVRKKARFGVPFLPVPLGKLYDAVMEHYPERHAYAVDNLWTHAPIADLLPGLRTIAETLPPAPSHVLWMNWAPPPGGRPEMAFSMEDDTYLALYAIWDPATDPPWASWPAERMRAMAHLASGIQLADENLAERPARFMAERNLARLDGVRAERDPSGTFHPWMGRP